MHLFDPEHKFSCSASSGRACPACGAGLRQKNGKRTGGQIAFFGEGAPTRVFHESLNLAALWNYVICVCKTIVAISVPKWYPPVWSGWQTVHRPTVSLA